MSRSINDSVQLLTETLENCKTALTEKEVADLDSIKISDVDEKIAEIKSNGNNSGIDDPVIGKYIHIESILINEQPVEDFSYNLVEGKQVKISVPFTTDKELPTLVKNTMLFMLVNDDITQMVQSNVGFENVPISTNFDRCFSVFLLYHISKNNKYFSAAERMCTLTIRAKS